jgi:hypothetical protein
MSTDYFVSLTAVSGEKTEIKIIDSINPLPLSDTWEGDEIALGSKGEKLRLGDGSSCSTYRSRHRRKRYPR